MDDHEDFYVTEWREIGIACTDALAILGLNGRFEVSFPTHITLRGREEWTIDFFDGQRKFRCCVSFVRPPHADAQWYTQEVIRQINQKLALV